MVSIAERDAWIENGWKRGSFIKIDEASSFFEMIPLQAQDKVKSGDEVYFFPVLNDCALVNPCFVTEPWVYGMVCWECKAETKDYLFAKNPRKYHFPVLVNGEEKHFEVFAPNLLTLNRQELFSSHPLACFTWPDHGLDRMLNWISERFRTPTFPDSWNLRLASKDKQLKKIWKSESFEKCSGVYFRIEPFKEISNDEAYDLWVYFCLPSEMSSAEYRAFQKESGPELRERLKSALGSIKNIKINEIDWISEDSFTKKIERDYKRWILEYYSYSSSSETEVPSEFVI